MEFLQNSCSVLRDRKRTQDTVAIAKWTHLTSSRTQKLSTFTATIVGLAPAKIASCRVLFLYICSVCLLFFYAFLAYNTNMHKILKYCKSKPIYIILAVLLQFLTLFFLVSYFSQRFFIVYYFTMN